VTAHVTAGVAALLQHFLSQSRAALERLIVAAHEAAILVAELTGLARLWTVNTS
jgi:hypothetical protein